MTDKQNNWDVAGKTCLVTGSSRGIGLYTALELAKKGAHVIVVSHDREHCLQAVNQIRDAAGEDSARYYVVDLSAQNEIRQFAEKVKTDYKRLDILVNNVGGWFTNNQESADGIEMTFALNHLSYFLLTGLLLDLLLQPSSARIINVSSDAHQQSDGIQFEDLEFNNKYRAFDAYAQSKLANILFTYELSNRLADKDIAVNALHPGFVSSELYRDYGIISPVIKFLAKIIGKNTKEGAETSIYLASSPEVADVTGKYFVDEKPENSSEASYDKDAQKRLWQVSEKMTSFSYPV